jgi:5-methylcytosine-specific restriction endonuclease McrBC regulatory subunit McrC
VRERIDFARQLTRQWDRRDVIACRYAEFLADTPMARLLKCACTMLAPRVAHRRALSLLNECLDLLHEAAAVSPREALSARVAHSERFALSCEWARRLLQSVAYAPQVGSVPSLVFLIDMNVLFEAYVRAALRAYFEVPIAAQTEIGALLRAPRQIAQRADFRWSANGQSWLGDAKYKFDAPNIVPRPSADDVRQITVYAEIARRSAENTTPNSLPNLALFYPFIGATEIAALRLTAWNEASLFAVPVRVLPLRNGRFNLRAALPNGF